MDIEHVRTILDNCERQESRDHAFGDLEVYWVYNGYEVASGYIGGAICQFYMTPLTKFIGDEARSLCGRGTLGAVSRNDETGPDEFVVGRTMPGLTKEGVLSEICRDVTMDEMFGNDTFSDS